MFYCKKNDKCCWKVRAAPDFTVQPQVQPFTLKDRIEMYRQNRKEVTPSRRELPEIKEKKIPQKQVTPLRELEETNKVRDNKK